MATLFKNIRRLDGPGVAVTAVRGAATVRRSVYCGALVSQPRAFVGAARVYSGCRESCTRSQDSRPWMRSFTTLREPASTDSSAPADAASALRKARWEAFFKDIGDTGKTDEKTENDDTKNPFTKGKVLSSRAGFGSAVSVELAATMMPPEMFRGRWPSSPS